MAMTIADILNHTITSVKDTQLVVNIKENSLKKKKKK